MDDVRLPDLEVIRRFSIAVKTEHAPASEVIAALRADLERLSGGRRSAADAPRPTPSRLTPSRPTARPAPERETAKPAARKPASKTAARKPATKATRSAKK